MKWIGQNIYNQVSRFRNDVFFETDTVTFTSASTDDPAITIQNTTDDNQAARLQFIKNRGAAGQDDDNVAEFKFYGYNDAGTPEQIQFGAITCEIDDATDGQESGSISVSVAAHDGSPRRAFLGAGGSTSNEVDVTLGNGTASVTTVAGTLTMGSTAAINNSGVIQVAAQTGITACANLVTVGTIGTGVWQGTAIASGYIADDAIISRKIADDAVNSEHYTDGSIDNAHIADNAIDSEHYADGSIDTAHIADDQVTFAKAIGVTPNVFGSVIKLIPSDFGANDDGTNTKFGVGYVESADTLYGMRVANNSTELFAFVCIPEGMKATHVDIFDKNNVGIVVYEARIDQQAIVSKGTGNCNTTVDITDVDATATNFLAIQVTTTSVNDKVYGGTVTIAAQ